LSKLISFKNYKWNKKSVKFLEVQSDEYPPKVLPKATDSFNVNHMMSGWFLAVSKANTADL